MAILSPLLDAMARWRRHRTPRLAAAGVLFVSSGGLGDTVLFSCVLPRFLRVVTKDEMVTVLLRKDGAKTAFLFPANVNVVVVDYNRLRRDRAYRHRVFDDIYRDHYRLVVSTDFLRHPLLDEALIAAAEPKRAVAMVARPWAKYNKRLMANRGLYARLFDSGPAHLDKVVRWARFADWLTGSVVAAPKITVARQGLASPAVLDRPTVVVQPFSAVRAKQPAVDIFTALMDDWGDGVDVVITAAPGEMEANPDYAALLDRANARLDTSTFEALVPLLRAAKLVVSVDTAMMHLAVCVGAPTVCLASAAYVGEIVPYAPEVCPDTVRFVYRPQDCEGCLGACVKPLVGEMYPCVAEISVEDAVAAAQSLMAT